jgi:hypothetical protein
VAAMEVGMEFKLFDDDISVLDFQIAMAIVADIEMSE